jgi:hypothetical protein
MLGQAHKRDLTTAPTLTVGESGVAFEKLFMYRSAKRRLTGSFRLMTVCSSGLPACVLCLSVMLAVPTSPEVENLMPSLVAEMSTTSPIEARSLMILVYSAEGSRASAECLLGARGRLAGQHWRAGMGPRPADPRGLSLLFRDAHLVCFNLHELEVEVRDPLALLRLEHQRQRVALILSLQGDDVIVACEAGELPPIGACSHACSDPSSSQPTTPCRHPDHPS